MAGKKISELLVEVAQNVPRVYESGIEEGKIREREAFWDALLQDGNRTDFAMEGVFAGYSWNFNNFYPTRDLIIRGDAYRLFYAWSTSAAHYGSLIERLNECGVRLDTSGATRMNGAFGYTRMSEIPTIDLTSSTDSAGIFGEAKNLKKIEKIIVVESTLYTRFFINNISLEEIRVEGTIGQNGFDIHWSTKLSKESIISIINALSTTTSGLTITLPHYAVNKAFEDHEGDHNGTQSVEWAELTATRSNWTIATI